MTYKQIKKLNQQVTQSLAAMPIAAPKKAIVRTMFVPAAVAVEVMEVEKDIPLEIVQKQYDKRVKMEHSWPGFNHF